MKAIQEDLKRPRHDIRSSSGEHHDISALLVAPGTQPGDSDAFNSSADDLDS